MGGRDVCQALINGILNLSLFIYVAIGIVVIGFSLWLRLDSAVGAMMRENVFRVNNSNSEMDEMKKNIRYFFAISLWVVCGCGITATLIGLLGVCGAKFSNRPALFLYLITSAMLISVELSIAVFVFIQKPAMKETITRYVNLADQLDDYLDDMSVIAARFKCCIVRDHRSAKCATVNQLPCTTAMWQDVESNLFIASYFGAGAVIQQTLTTLFCSIKIASNF